MQTSLGMRGWGAISKSSGWGFCGDRSISIDLRPNDVHDAPILDAILERNPSLKKMLIEYEELEKQRNELYDKSKKMEKEIERTITDTLLGSISKNGKSSSSNNNNKKSRKKQ